MSEQPETKKVYNNYKINVLYLDIVTDQGQLWKETLADDPVVDEEARRGGLTPMPMNERLYHDIQLQLGRLIGKAEQLLGNETTNLCESWMHIRTKFDGGKVINRSQSGSWEHRSMGAGLRQNFGRVWGPPVWRCTMHSSPNKVYTNAAERSAKALATDRKRKATDKAKQQRRRSKYARKDDTAVARSAYNRHDGGIEPDQVTEDVTPEELAEEKARYYRTYVAVSQVQIKEIEEQTRDQADSDYWRLERRKRITASQVGGIAKMRETTKKANKVHSLLYSKFRGNKATRYGSTNEDITRKQYIAYQRRNYHPELNVDDCGLFVSQDNNWLAATPDGLVTDPSNEDNFGLLEIKNPYSMRDMDFNEACKKSSFCLQVGFYRFFILF